MDGIPTLCSARKMVSFTRLCRRCLPALRRQSMLAKLIFGLRPTAILSALSSRLRPRDALGMAFSHTPDSGAQDARSRASVHSFSPSLILVALNPCNWPGRSHISPIPFHISSALQTTKGSGWVRCFQDPDGKEQRKELSGAGSGSQKGSRCQPVHSTDSNATPPQLQTGLSRNCRRHLDVEQ